MLQYVISKKKVMAQCRYGIHVSRALDKVRRTIAFMITPTSLATLLSWNVKGSFMVHLRKTAVIT
jgi:hypothetical protein